MTEQDLALYTPEEISEMMRGKVPAYTLRRLAREGELECIRAERGKILFTYSMVKKMLDAWTRGPAVKPKEPQAVALAFQGTSRSKKARLKM